jgi:hypothetical protein
LSDKNLRSYHVGLSMVQEKPSSVRRFLSYGVKPNRFNVYKRTTFLILKKRFTYKFVIPDIKTKQNIFFDFFWNIGQVLMTLINWLLKQKCMLKNIYIFWSFLCCIKIQYDFLLALRDLAVSTKKKFFFFNVFKVLTKTRYFNTEFVSLR